VEEKQGSKDSSVHAKTPQVEAAWFRITADNVTCGIQVQDNVIVFAPPIFKVWQGQSFGRFKGWLLGKFDRVKID
jgi:hypothetical protein